MSSSRRGGSSVEAVEGNSNVAAKCHPHLNASAALATRSPPPLHHLVLKLLGGGHLEFVDGGSGVEVCTSILGDVARRVERLLNNLSTSVESIQRNVQWSKRRLGSGGIDELSSV